MALKWQAYADEIQNRIDAATAASDSLEAQSLVLEGQMTVLLADIVELDDLIDDLETFES